MKMNRRLTINSRTLLIFQAYVFLPLALGFVKELHRVPSSFSNLRYRCQSLPVHLNPQIPVSNINYSSNPEERKLGTLTLIGSGPGDPELLTVKAVKALRNADLVVADRLVSKEILDIVKCELLVARKYPGCAEEAQQEIYRWVKNAIQAGQNVVRLKIGDPFIFGRGGEEILEARQWGIECAVIPGISSVFSAPLLAGIPVTHRGVANQVVLGTGYAKDYGTPDISDYHPEQTAVFLMAVGRLKELCADLTLRGYPIDTPVAIVESASLPTQRVIAGTIESIVDIAKFHNVKAPATIIVGNVVRVLHKDAIGLIQDCHLSNEETIAVSLAEYELISKPCTPQLSC